MSVLHLIAFLSVGILLSLAALVCLAGDRGDAFAGFKAFRRSHGRFDKVALAVLASLLMFFAGAKHGGTNGVDQTGGDASTNAPPSGPMMSPRRPVASVPPLAAFKPLARIRKPEETIPPWMKRNFSALNSHCEAITKPCHLGGLGQTALPNRTKRVGRVAPTRRIRRGFAIASL